MRRWLIPITVGLLLGLLPNASAQTRATGQATEDRIRLDERLRNIERRMDGLKPSEYDGHVQATAEIAKMTMEAYERHFGVVKWIAGVASAIVALVVAGFAFFGVRQWRHVVRPIRRSYRTAMRTLSEAQSRLETLMRKVSDEEGKLAQVRTDLEGLMRRVPEEEEKLAQVRADLEKEMNQFQVNVKALVHTVSAFTNVHVGWLLDRPDFFPRALPDLDKALTMAPTDPKVLAWAHSMRGFLKKRLHQDPAGGLEDMEESLTHDPTNERTLYNAACYAALTGARGKWIDYLRRAVDISPQFARDASEDHDFEHVWGDEAFRQITGQD